MVLVDASVWIDYLNGIETPQADWLERHLGDHLLGLTDITLCEVLQGIDRDHQARRVEEILLGFDVFPTGGAELALATAANYRALRRKGLTVRKTIDCWIATFCLREGHTLLHSDRDFEPFRTHLGLQVVAV